MPSTEHAGPRRVQDLVEVFNLKVRADAAIRLSTDGGR